MLDGHQPLADHRSGRASRQNTYANRCARRWQPQPPGLRAQPVRAPIVYLGPARRRHPAAASAGRRTRGLDRPAGIGDVRVWPSPWATLRGEQVVIALSSPDGHAGLGVPRRLLVRFLRRTRAAVPPGQETAHHDLDAALARVLR